MKYKWVALSVTTVGVLMVGIDTRIVIVGLPQVAAQLQADAEQAIWITQSYVLANTVLLLLIGRLGDIFGRVRIYTVGFGIFTIGSALTSIGIDPLQVIVFRAVQGVGAALVFANSIAILTDATPKNELGFSLGINQIAFRSGAILGLTLSSLSCLSWIGGHCSTLIFQLGCLEHFGREGGLRNLWRWNEMSRLIGSASGYSLLPCFV